MNTVTETIKRQPRWSDCDLYYQCDYETFKKLKFLHKSYWQTLKDYAQWMRWDQKLPENRKGPEPKFCPSFVSRAGSWGNVHAHITDYGIIRFYQEARHPSKTPVEPFDEATIKKIESLYFTVLRTMVDCN